MDRDENPAERRVLQQLPDASRVALERGLSPTDLRTLLIAVARSRAALMTPAEVMRRWTADRFVRPASSDPRLLARVEAALWDLLPDQVAGVELSPVTPIGTCAAVAGVSQNRIVTTTRLTEVVSDSTTVLAVEAATRRAARSGEAVHLAAVQRQLRAQRFGGDAAAHFRLFSLVSSARDSGSARTEAQLLLVHLGFWLSVLNRFLPKRRPQVELALFDRGAVAERIADTVRPALSSGAVRIVDDPDRTRARGYYRALAIRVAADGGAIELGDGGFTTWTATLMNDAKEKCLTSCLSTERLADLVG